MKYTLLEIVQTVLSDMSSDFVNNIDDTVESQQVANIARDVYVNWMSNRNWHHQRRLIQLDHSADVSKPNYLRRPKGLKELISLSYDVRGVNNRKQNFQPLKYLDPEAFLRMLSQRDNLKHNVREVEDFSGVKLNIYSHQHPKYWTTFDDEWIVTDAYNCFVDDTLQKSKTMATAYIMTPWEHRNDAVPDLPEDAFAGFIEEIKSTASYKIREVPDEKAEANAMKQNIWLAQKNWQLHGGLEYPDYGRKRRKYW